MSEVEQRRDGGDDAARIARARRSAWVLGAVALALYVGYMVWFLIRGSIG